MIVFPNCKINLGLHILRKREDGFHDLEAVFYPIPLQDGLEVIQNPSPETDVEFTSSGLTIQGNPSGNSCVKAYHLLKKDFPQLASVKMHLHKTIPMGAGLGGGSADGAFTLLLLNKKFNLNIPEEKRMDYALQLGSDCPFFIKNTACYATGRGEVLEEVALDLSAYKFVIVNPAIHVNTAWAFSQAKPSSNKPFIKDTIQQPVERWKNSLSNDFEQAVFPHHPEIKECKDKLYKAGALYASMTGSGSTVYGIFAKEESLSLDFPPHYFVKII